jgi:hypothetical protein
MAERDTHLPGSPPIEDAEHHTGWRGIEQVGGAAARRAEATRLGTPSPPTAADRAGDDADALVRPPDMDEEEWEDYLEFREFQKIGFRSNRAELERRRKKKP